MPGAQAEIDPTPRLVDGVVVKHDLLFSCFGMYDLRYSRNEVVGVSPARWSLANPAVHYLIVYSTYSSSEHVDV